MIRHPYFNIRLHTDEELNTILGSRVGYRQTLHEWPLSCVQEIRLADGRRLVYKAQWGPSVESRFYRSVKSPLIVPAWTIYNVGQYQSLVMPFIEAPSLGRLNLPVDGYLQSSNLVCDQIAEIDYHERVYLDFGSREKWDAIATRLIRSLSRLVNRGEFSLVTNGSINLISCMVRSPGLVAVFDQPAVLSHGDLTGDNLFKLVDDGYKVIDWQRPYLGPPGLDRISLLDSCGFALPGAQEPGLVALYWLLRVAWFTDCAVHWFIPGVKTYDRQIADLIGQIAELSLD